MTNVQISCRKQASRRGTEYGRAVQRDEFLRLGRKELRLEAAASAEGRGADASAVKPRWRVVYQKAFIRAGLALKKKGT